MKPTKKTICPCEPACECGPACNCPTGNTSVSD
jgi:hypothetical protein